MDLFGRTFRYEKSANKAIQKARDKWGNIEDILASLEWGIMHDPLVGRLLDENGVRSFTFPGARSINEPDIDVFYREEQFQIIILELDFREAKASYAGRA